MSAIPETGARGLVRLLRSLSPRELPAIPSIFPAELAGKLSAPLPRRPRAVLFDLYGTLFASAAGGEPGLAGKRSHDGCGAARTLLERELRAAGHQGGTAAFDLEVVRAIGRFRSAAAERRPFPEIDIEEVVSSVIPASSPAAVRKIALLHEAWRNPCAPMPGAVGLVAWLRAAGLRLGIVSNAQFYTPLLFEALLGSSPAQLGFEDALSVYSFRTGMAKPDTALFKLAAAPLFETGIAPGDILVVGNSAANDIAPAAVLGFMTAHFGGDARSFRPSPGASTAALPDTLIDGLERLETTFPAT